MCSLDPARELFRVALTPVIRFTTVFRTVPLRSFYAYRSGLNGKQTVYYVLIRTQVTTPSILVYHAIYLFTYRVNICVRYHCTLLVLLSWLFFQVSFVSWKTYARLYFSKYTFLYFLSSLLWQYKLFLFFI